MFLFIQGRELIIQASAKSMVGQLTATVSGEGLCASNLAIAGQAGSPKPSYICILPIPARGVSSGFQTK
jgi:hypothetical protein